MAPAREAGRRPCFAGPGAYHVTRTSAVVIGDETRPPQLSRLVVSMSQEKQEADYTAEVDTLLPQLEKLNSLGLLQEALDLVIPLEKKARGASDVLSTARLLLTSVLMIRTTPDVAHTDIEKLCETIHSFSKKHGQSKFAIVRMIQLTMLFLQASDTSDMRAPTSLYAIIGKDSLQTQDVAMESTEATENMAVDEESKKADSKPSKDDELDREGKEDDRITALMRHARAIGDTSLNDAAKMKIMQTLRDITAGKVFLEVERARVSRSMSDMLYAKGEVDKAADTLQDLAVETFGSLSRREKVEFILEQMRLNVERTDMARANMLSRKVNTKFFDDEEQQGLKLLYYELMIQIGVHDGRYLDVCKYYREVLSTPSIRSDEEKSKDVLRHVIIFLILSPFDNEQSDLVSRVESTESLDMVPEYKSLLKCFTTPELMRWPGIEALYGPMLRQLVVFSGSPEAEERWKQLHARVVEYNIQVVAKYYTQIHLERLAQLLDLPVNKAEEALADLVVKKTTHARIDRPAQIVNFQSPMTDAEVLNHWSNDMSKLLQTIEKVSHLVEKEWAIQRAGLVVKANE